MSKFLTKRDAIGLAVVLAAALAMEAYRAAYIEPRAWGVLCAATPHPLACEPRAALLWMQREYLWGGSALALGLWAFLIRRPFPVAILATVCGIAGVQNYNATWGMVGAALGVWSWVTIRKEELLF